MPPTIANGKICYIEIPATDIARSSEFYQAVFGWNIRQRGDGQKAFDDAVGEVSGTWVTGRPPAKTPGLLVYVMVDDVHATLEGSSEWRGGSSSQSARTHPRSPQESLTLLGT